MKTILFLIITVCLFDCVYCHRLQRNKLKLLQRQADIKYYSTCTYDDHTMITCTVGQAKGEQVGKPMREVLRDIVSSKGGKCCGMTHDYHKADHNKNGIKEFINWYKSYYKKH